MSHSKELTSSLLNAHSNYLGLGSPIFSPLNFIQPRILPIEKNKTNQSFDTCPRMFGMILVNERGVFIQ